MKLLDGSDAAEKENQPSASKGRKDRDKINEYSQEKAREQEQKLKSQEEKNAEM